MTTPSDGESAMMILPAIREIFSEDGDHSTVDIDDLAADVVGRGRGEVDTGSRKFIGASPPPRGSTPLHPGIEGRIVDQRLVHVGDHVTRSDGVGLDAEFRPL